MPLPFYLLEVRRADRTGLDDDTDTHEKATRAWAALYCLLGTRCLGTLSIKNLTPSPFPKGDRGAGVATSGIGFPLASRESGAEGEVSG